MVGCLFWLVGQNDAKQSNSVETVRQLETPNDIAELEPSLAPSVEVVVASQNDQNATGVGIEEAPLQDVFANRAEIDGPGFTSGLSEEVGLNGDFSRAEWRRQLDQAKQVSETAETVITERQKHLDKVLAPNLEELKSLAKVEINYQIDQWRNAWSNGLVEQYLVFYSDEFVPSGGQDLQQWRDQRRTRINPDRGIFVELRNFDVSFNTDLDRATVYLEQDYRAANYAEVSQKQIIFAKEGTAWRIVLEEQLSP